MVRVTVSCYLMLAAVLGPGLCSCSLLRLTSPCCHDEPSEQGKKPCQHAAHHGCQGHDDGDTKPCSDHPQPPDEPPYCPCRDHESIPVAFLTTELQPQLNLLQATTHLWVVDSVPTTANSVLPENPRLWQEDTIFPYLTCQRILRALHMLRC